MWLRRIFLIRKKVASYHAYHDPIIRNGEHLLNSGSIHPSVVLVAVINVLETGASLFKRKLWTTNKHDKQNKPFGFNDPTKWVKL